jgi:hypothetical protein
VGGAGEADQLSSGRPLPQPAPGSRSRSAGKPHRTPCDPVSLICRAAGVIHDRHAIARRDPLQFERFRAVTLSRTARIVAANAGAGPE